MQPPPPPSLAGEAGGDGVVALTGEGIERIVADFRDWLARLPVEPPATPPTEAVDLATVVRNFTALRQEVNLQTRASRAQLEQNAKALEQLGQAVEQLREPAVDPAEVVRPLLKALIDIRDALALAQKQVAKTRETLTSTQPPRVSLALPYWTRWFELDSRIRAAIAPLQQWAQARVDSEPLRPLVESLAVGYAMSLQRVDRALEQHGLERIACVGLPFDPEIMEVVEVVKDENRTGTEVLEDVRPGYRYRSQLFRCAQVRVVRP